MSMQTSVIKSVCLAVSVLLRRAIYVGKVTKYYDGKLYLVNFRGNA